MHISATQKKQSTLSHPEPETAVSNSYNNLIYAVSEIDGDFSRKSPFFHHCI